MIKIDLDSTLKGKNKFLLKGSINVSGDHPTLAHEIYTILKDFEKEIPEAMEMAMERLVNEMSDELEEE